MYSDSLVEGVRSFWFVPGPCVVLRLGVVALSPLSHERLSALCDELSLSPEQVVCRLLEMASAGSLIRED